MSLDRHEAETKAYYLALADEPLVTLERCRNCAGKGKLGYYEAVTCDPCKGTGKVEAKLELHPADAYVLGREDHEP